MPNPRFLGNPASSWIFGAIIALVVFLFCNLIRKHMIQRFSRIGNKIDQVVASVVAAVAAKTQIFFVLTVALYAGLLNVDLSRSRENFISKFVVVTVVIQFAIWIATGIGVWVDATIDHRKDMEGGRKTTLLALGLFGRIAIWIFAVILCLDNLGFNISALVAGLGIGGVAVALAVQNILGDLLASLSITLDQPFVVGDVIAVDNLTGTVENVGLKTTRVRSATGELLILSNGDLLRSRLRNFRSIRERLCTCRFEISGDTSVEKLQAIPRMMEEIVGRQDKTRFERAGLWEVNAGNLVFELVYVVLDGQYQIMAETRHQVNLAILSALSAEGVRLATPGVGVPVPGKMG